MLFGSGIACEHDEEIPEPFSYLTDLKVVLADSHCSALIVVQMQLCTQNSVFLEYYAMFPCSLAYFQLWSLPFSFIIHGEINATFSYLSELCHFSHNRLM